MNMPFESCCAVASIVPLTLNDSSAVSGSRLNPTQDSIVPGWLSEMTVMDWVVVRLPHSS